MKKQKLALYFVVLGCFGLCLFVLNRKYDRFYRINGINNENRQLITNYLSSEEQNYLVENSFAMDRFARFLTVPDFNLFDLEYYEQIESKKHESSQKVVKYTNELLEKLRSEETIVVKSTFKDLMKTDLYDLYLKTPAFSIELLDMYDVYYKSIGKMGTKEVKQINELVAIMKNNQLSYEEQIDFLSQWDSQYQLQDLMSYWQITHNNQEVTLVKNPESLTTVISQNQTISSYEPGPLTIPDVARVRFACYLRQDATVALEELFEASLEAVEDETLLLVDAYRSYDDYLSSEESYAGDSEYQLGLSVDLMSMDINYRDFKNTNMSAFLEAHSWEYGFVLRYPKTNSANTYRFVGKDAAKVMHEKKLTLEEYEGIVHE